MSRVFCSDAARLRGEDNAATAARIDVWILVELTIPWGRNPLDDAVLPPPVTAHLRRAKKEVVRSRIVFIQRRLESRSGCRVYVVRSFPDTRSAAVDLPSVADVASLDFKALAAVPPTAPLTHEPSLPLVLVCTHGQHDSCCGRRGFPLYDALRHQPELDVWQCSHIGGDRFAANAVVLPWGIYYGPVEPREAQALTDSIQRDEILLPAYRGRCSMSRVEQAAETFVRRGTGLLSRDALRVLSRESLGAARSRVRLRDATGIVHEVTVEQYATEEARLTCTAGVASPIPQFRLLEHVRS